MTFVQPTPTLTMTIIDNITLYASDVNKTRPMTSNYEQ